MTHSTSTNKYFALHTYGMGYVNCIREVPVKSGDSYWVCDISALHGTTDDIQYTRFDCRVSGTEAERLIKLYEGDCQNKKKILIGFKLGDLCFWNKTGQPGVSLKANLLYINWVKIDGESVYTAPPKAVSKVASSASVPMGDELFFIPRWGNNSKPRRACSSR